MSDIHALVGAYAVDALDDIERQQFERHLATCADCRDEVASLRDASSMLSGIPLSPPPPSLRNRKTTRLQSRHSLLPRMPSPPCMKTTFSLTETQRTPKV